MQIGSPDCQVLSSELISSVIGLHNAIKSQFLSLLSFLGPCANPGTPRNGLKIGSDFRHGRKVTFVCQAGFKLTGISSITCQDGRWSDPVPVCKGNRGV